MAIGVTLYGMGATWFIFYCADHSYLASPITPDKVRKELPLCELNANVKDVFVLSAAAVHRPPAVYRRPEFHMQNTSLQGREIAGTRQPKRQHPLHTWSRG